METPKLGRTRQRVLQLIIDRYLHRQPCPTVRELGAAVGVTSSSTVQSHTDALERLGLLQRGGRGVTRNLRPTETALKLKDSVLCPHCHGTGLVQQVQQEVA